MIFDLYVQISFDQARERERTAWFEGSHGYIYIDRYTYICVCDIYIYIL